MSWTKEAPKVPGFYWFRYPQMIPVNRDDNPTIARVMGSPLSDRLTVAFPGNEDCPQPINIPGDPEWWSEPIRPPGEQITVGNPCEFPFCMADKCLLQPTCKTSSNLQDVVDQFAALGQVDDQFWMNRATMEKIRPLIPQIDAGRIGPFASYQQAGISINYDETLGDGVVESGTWLKTERARPCGEMPIKVVRKRFQIEEMVRIQRSRNMNNEGAAR